MRWFLLLGRLLFGGLFIWAAARHVMEASALTAAVAAHSVPYPEAAVFISTLLLALGGSSIVLGLAPRVGLGAISLFLLAVTPIMHAFWMSDDPATRSMELSMFMKNVALLGAAIGMLAIPVPWPLSVDAWIARSGHFGGDLLSQLKPRLKGMLGRMRPRSASGTAANTHAALAARPDRGVPSGTCYVSRSWAASSDGGVLIHNVHAYYRPF
jgi:putative oxidoreductase